MIYRFDEFEVDDREFRLSSGGAPVPLEPKVLRLLLCLIENRNRLVRKQELLDKVWPDAAVTENALTRAIGLLRKALNDDSHLPRFLETVPTAGYRFIANVTVVESNNSVLEPIAAPKPASTTATDATKFRASTRWVIASSILALVAVGTGLSLFVRHRKPVPTEKATVVLANFDNSTGEPVIESTLRQSLATQFDQPPFVTMTDERIQGVLRMMGQPAGARLTPAIAREICVRTSSAVALDGSIAPIGAQYVLGLRSTDCRNGKDHRSGADAGGAKRRRAGCSGSASPVASKFESADSLADGEMYDNNPIYEVTTPSMAALTSLQHGKEGVVCGAERQRIALLVASDRT